jgi:hypothetical protein
MLMRNFVRITVAAAIFLVLPAVQAAQAECQFPPRAPQMPQGATASDDDMKEGREALQKYVDILQTYQTCMEQQIKDAPLDTPAELKRRWAERADAAIDAAHQIADVYSIQLRVFKSRQ